VLVAVVGDAGGGAAAGAGDDEQARVAGDEVDQGLQAVHGGIVRALAPHVATAVAAGNIRRCQACDTAV